MNKKNLSVVMAGAMLATSVAPVLAEETTTVNKYELPGDQVGTLIAGLRDKMDNGPKFHNNDANATLAGQSIYYVKKNGEKIASLDALKEVKTGDVVTVWDYGHRTDAYGNVFSTEETGTEGKAKTYADEDALVSAFNAMSKDDASKGTSKTVTGSNIETDYPTIKSISYDKDAKTVTVLTGNNLEFVLKEGSEVLKFNEPVDKNGVALKNDASSSTDVAGYKVDRESSSTTGKDIADVKLEEITITSSANGFNVSDLYDGLMLTEDGHDLMTEIKNDTDSSTKFYKLDGTNSGSDITNVDSSFGIYGFVVKYKDAFGKTKEYTITGDNKERAEELLSWLKAGKAKVDLLAGSNRYETAVKVAKSMKTPASITAGGNIVLVNGNSLVDGLAAAPLAAAKNNAPILLTEAGKLPTATKNYLKEIVGTVPVGQLDQVTINIVGGKSVVSKSVETELKDMGFSVNRVAGDNREETSLAVMDEMGATVDSEVFVVGANGEADAMSIAPVASTKYNTSKLTPIVVAKNGGLSEDALEALEGKNVTVVGGNKVVTDAEYAAIESVAKNTQRVAGANRKATNAAIIEKYYTLGGSNKVLVAKDGQNNKSELIDSLSATILAATENAPIVLATDKLSTEQVNAVELHSQASSGNDLSLAQIGHGVDRNVVLSIAKTLGLAK